MSMCEEIKGDDLSQSFLDELDDTDYQTSVPLPNGRILSLYHMHDLCPVENQLGKYVFTLFTTLKTYNFSFNNPEDAFYLWQYFAKKMMQP